MSKIYDIINFKRVELSKNGKFGFIALPHSDALCVDVSTIALVYENN